MFCQIFLLFLKFSITQFRMVVNAGFFLLFQPFMSLKALLYQHVQFDDVFVQLSPYS